MSTPTPAFAAKRAATPQFLDRVQGEELEQLIQARIAERAYALYEESGHQPGNDRENWLQAKSEVLQDLAARETGTWLALTASIPDASPESIQINVAATRVVVRAKKAENAIHSESSAPAGPSDIILASELGVEVEPSTATASFKEQTLHVMVKKRTPGTIVSPLSYSKTNGG